MHRYEIHIELFSGLKKTIDVFSDHIERDIKEIEDIQDSVGQPIMDIRYEKIS